MKTRAQPNGLSLSVARMPTYTARNDRPPASLKLPSQQKRWIPDSPKIVHCPSHVATDLMTVAFAAPGESGAGPFARATSLSLVAQSFRDKVRSGPFSRATSLSHRRTRLLTSFPVRLGKHQDIHSFKCKGNCQIVLDTAQSLRLCSSSMYDAILVRAPARQ